MKFTSFILISCITASVAFTPTPYQSSLRVRNDLTLLKASASSKKSKKDEKDENPAKKAALEGVLQKIERSYGRGSIVKLGDADNMIIDSISSGALTLDTALGGGYPRGRIVEIYGPESSGKTTLALHAIAESQKQGGTAAFVDAEHALDPLYAHSLGVDVDELFVSQPDCGEMALDIVDHLVRSSAMDVIVIDSVAALVPRAELEGSMADQQIGLQARLMSKAMRKITGSLAMSKCTVIFINQLRSKVGVIFGSPEVTSGGNALKFYSSVRLDVRRREILPDNVGIKVKVKVVKNKVAPPFKVVTLDIIFGEGIDSMGCLIDAALELDIIERKGSWYSFDNKNFAQGKQNAIVHLKNNIEFAEEITTTVKDILSNKGDVDATVEVEEDSQSADDSNNASSKSTNEDASVLE